MTRRSSPLVTLVAALLLALPAVASADDTPRLEAPDNGSVAGPTEVRFSLARDAVDPEARSVRVRAAAGSEEHEAPCVAGCTTRSPVHAFDIDPRSGAPFAGGPLPNGPLEFDALVSRTGGVERNVGRLTLTLRVPGSAVGGLSATAQAGEVRVAWSRAPEPDVTGYRVERCLDSCDDGAWDVLAVQPPSTSSFTDRPRPGSHSYRVVTTRSTGGDGSIETVSSPVAASVEAPAPAASTDGEGADGGGADGDAGRPAGGSAAPAPTRSPAAPDDGEVGDGADGTPRRPVSDDTTSEAGRGDAGARGVRDLDDRFRGTLDDGRDAPDARDGADDDVPDPTPADEAVVLGAPDSATGTSAGLTEPGRVAVSAVALLVMVVSLGLWRRFRPSR